MTINLASVNVPNVYTQIIPPAPLLNGVPTDIIVLVGTATWGPKNSPVPCGAIQEYVQIFGTPLTNKYDMGTHVYFASLQGGSNFRCIRVTDGTDTAAVANLLEDAITVGIGAFLTSKYTGSTGNNILATISQGTSYTPTVPTYKLSVSISGGFPEVFDNIGGVGGLFWSNLVSAVNLGQSSGRGPSNLVIASIGTAISSITVTLPGSYTAIPVVSIITSTGSGATFGPKVSLLTASGVSAGTGYDVGDQLLFATQGTFTTSAVLTVDTVLGGGEIDTFSVTTAGSYSVLPVGTLTPSSTTGTGTGATFDFDTWGLASVAVLTGGIDYESTDTVAISGSGGATATLAVGSVAAPLKTTSTFSGGTDGLAGVDDNTLVGDDFSNPRTGMYAARNAIQGGILVLCDVTDEETYSLQNEFGIEEFCYVIGAMAAGFQDNLNGAATIIQDAGVDSSLTKIAAFSATLGDWVYINDPFNNVRRYISPQSFKAGVLASLLPSESSLNKPLVGVIGTQKTIEGRTYSYADLSFLRSSRIDVLTNPIPSGSQYGWRLGINVSSNAAIQTDNYVRMVNFLAATINNGLGQYVGAAQTPDVRRSAKSTLESFLYNLFFQNIIGDVNNPGINTAAYKVILDDSNNPPEREKLGFMQADVQVVLFPIIQFFIVNVHAQQGISIQTFAQAA